MTRHWRKKQKQYKVLKGGVFLPFYIPCYFPSPKVKKLATLRKILLQHSTLWVHGYDSACSTTRSGLETADATSWKPLSNLLTKPSRKSFIRNSSVHLPWVSLQASLSTKRLERLHGRGWAVKCFPLAVNWKGEQGAFSSHTSPLLNHAPTKTHKAHAHACAHTGVWKGRKSRRCRFNGGLFRCPNKTFRKRVIKTRKTGLFLQCWNEAKRCDRENSIREKKLEGRYMRGVFVSLQFTLLILRVGELTEFSIGCP